MQRSNTDERILEVEKIVSNVKTKIHSLEHEKKQVTDDFIKQLTDEKIEKIRAKLINP